MQLTGRCLECVGTLFGSEDLVAAEDMLAKLPDFPDAERLQLAAVRFSSGTLERLDMAIKLGNADPRDLLMAAGFGNLNDHQKWVPQRIDDSVLEQWRTGTLPDDVDFRLNQRVQKVGRRRAKIGIVVALVHLEPQPCYRVNLESIGERDVWQSELQPE